MSIKKYCCKECYWTFELDMWTDDNDPKPKYCPICGLKWEVIKTPAEIVKEIESLYHEENLLISTSEREDRMRNLLYQLKRMAEENEPVKNKPINDYRPTSAL